MTHNITTAFLDRYQRTKKENSVIMASALPINMAVIKRILKLFFKWSFSKNTHFYSLLFASINRVQVPLKTAAFECALAYSLTIYFITFKNSAL